MIVEFACAVMETTGLISALRKDTSMPDGASRKLMSSDRLLSVGRSPAALLQGRRSFAYGQYLENVPV